MENSTIEQLEITKNMDYVPLKDFHKHIKSQVLPAPYLAKFSFFKLIQSLKTKNAAQNKILSETIAHLEELEEKLQEGNNTWEELYQQEDFDLLMAHIFPSFFFKDQLGFIKGPFENHQFRFRTKPFINLLEEDRWEIKLNNQRFMSSNTQNILLAGIVVLNTFYKQELDIYTGEGMVLRDRNTFLERHYKFNMELDFMEVKAIKPLKKLSKKKIQELLDNPFNDELWVKHIPPEHFTFEGFIIGFINDVTREEILSIGKELAAQEGGKANHESDLNYLEILIRSYLNMPDLRLGAIQTIDLPWSESLTWSLLRHHNEQMLRTSLNDRESAYGQLFYKEKPIIVEDLSLRQHLSPLENALLEQGVRSLLLAPLTNDDGRLVSIFELASPEPYRFSQFTLIQLEAFISIFETGTNKFIQEMENSVRLTIQQEFTSIHPSVEWKFREVASKCFWERVIEGQQASPDPIVFKNVYPLYGQADIVGSSRQRNNSIKKDLTDNLERLHQLLTACRATVHFHLFDVYAEKVKDILDRFNAGDFVSSDESTVVELLTQQIHPLLRTLSNRFPKLPHSSLQSYFDYLDPELDIVYRHRKDYEDSVSLLNRTISHYLLQEEEKMQEILPHYFEKFQTDGVEYNLYLGKTLLEDGEFHDFYLKDFRLWQLIVMCEITRLVARKSKSFPMPLTTAQLVFVYNSSLSIRFQMDEKQFDVDGAYNVRYEILKKRIDKAYIKGTDERLTQAGKIAIVWLQEKDRMEYQEYLDHLVRNKYIKPEIEDLDLERMQGVEGLKAIRVEVIEEEG